MDDKSKKPAFNTFSTRPERGLKKPQFRRPVGMIRTLLLSACFLLLGFGGGWLGAAAHGDSAPNTKSAKQQYVSSESQLINDIAKNTGQSVVSVDVQSQVTGQDIFGFDRTGSQEAAGTGIIISSDGVIMTNRHVVPDGTTTVSVTLADGTQYKDVQVLGRTSDTNSLDVAFLKIGDLKGKKLVPATLGDSSKVLIGDRVVAIGNALGQFQNTVTSGIISGYGRDLTAGDSNGSSSESLTDLFQTDAAINEGNSGGPLTNINGEVIGLNTATAADAQNIGFAIPINDLKGIINGILKSGQLQQAYLGVRYVSITADVATQYNLSATQGAYVVSGGDGTPAVVPDSPADHAGLKDGDIITKVNSITLNSKTSLTGALSQFQPGDKVTLTVSRDGKTINLSATLGNAPTN